MHRFGRSSDQRWRDRWGGGFVIVTVLALAGAWYLGNYLSERWNPDTAETITDPAAATDTMYPTGITGSTAAGGNLVATTGAADLAGYPKPMTVYYLQAHSLATQDRVNRAVRDLNNSGLPAAYYRDGDGQFKVIIGAYGSKEAVTQAKVSAESQYKGKLAAFPRAIAIGAQPALKPADAKATPAFEQGVAALNGYLHAAADWWDAHATGQTQTADHLSIYTSQLRSAMNQLKGFGADAAVNQFLALADKALTNGDQLAAAAGSQGTAPAAAQGGALAAQAGAEPMWSAMEGYVALLDSYRNWTAPARQP